MENKLVKCGNLSISNNGPFTLIAGPCQLENEKHAISVAEKLKEITQKLNIGLIYKTSFDKANRTSFKGKRGVGLENSLPVFDKIRKNLDIPVLTDVHTIDQCEIVSKHVDILIVLLYALYEDVCLVCNVNALKSKLLLPTLSTIKLRSYFFYHDHTWGNSSFLS